MTEQTTTWAGANIEKLDHRLILVRFEDGNEILAQVEPDVDLTKSFSARTLAVRWPGGEWSDVRPVFDRSDEARRLFHGETE